MKCSRTSELEPGPEIPTHPKTMTTKITPNTAKSTHETAKLPSPAGDTPATPPSNEAPSPRPRHTPNTAISSKHLGTASVHHAGTRPVPPEHHPYINRKVLLPQPSPPSYSSSCVRTAIPAPAGTVASISPICLRCACCRSLALSLTLTPSLTTLRLSLSLTHSRSSSCSSSRATHPLPNPS
jgi:hypothetical protein